MSRRDPRLAALLLVAALAAGCSAGQTGSAGSTAASGPATLDQLTTAYLAYAHCARTHGMPDLPDPVVDQQGNDSYPALDAQGSWRWPPSVLTGCASVWAQVRAVRDRYDASHGLSERGHAMTPAQALTFARCVRHHGFPSFPDPGPEGTIQQPPPGWTKPNLSAQAQAAIRACTPVALGGSGG